MSRGRERTKPAERASSGLYARFLSLGRPCELGLVALLCAACSGRGDGATSGTKQPTGARDSSSFDPFPKGVGHVGNQVKGIDAIPDYDQEARDLRTRVEPQLPDPLPSSEAACITMLDTARRFYVDTEGEQSTAVQTMDATREADLRDCVEQTPPAAATCTAVLMVQSEGEFPWLLDQCSRAFPSANPKSQ